MQSARGRLGGGKLEFTAGQHVSDAGFNATTKGLCVPWPGTVAVRVSASILVR